MIKAFSSCLIRLGDFVRERGLGVGHRFRPEANDARPAPEIDGEDISATMFCNIKKKCMSINKECANMELSKTKLKQQLMMDMLSQFDEELQLNQENHKVVLSFFFPRFNLLFSG